MSLSILIIAWLMITLLASGAARLCWIVDRPEGRIVRTALIALPALAIIAPPALVALALVLNAMDPPTDKFSTVFGVDLPDSVVSIRASEKLGSDFDRICLALVVAPDDWPAMEHGLALEQSPRFPRADCPAWWKAKDCPDLVSFVSRAKGKIDWDSRVIFWCPDSGNVYVDAWAIS